MDSVWNIGCESSDAKQDLLRAYYSSVAANQQHGTGICALAIHQIIKISEQVPGGRAIDQPSFALFAFFAADARDISA
jgi:hypothetical protein